ncbi:C-x8-C-x5-C-x3-H type zinc finger protein-like protein [Xylariaceae sp. FL1019]|nr:C-x8-C-x5-C-x3-H type zinc finger protein-like protein [Xylariaceae sp. FL1019]
MEPTSVMDFVPRYKAREREAVATSDFIKDLMIYAERLETTRRNENNQFTQQIRDLNLDVEDALKSYRQVQLQLQHVQQGAGYVSFDQSSTKDQFAYVLVVIDGNHLIFRDHLIREGVEGGRRAAHELRKAVAFQTSFLGQAEIVIKIVANLANLNKVLRASSLVYNDVDLPEFVTGFNQVKASFDFVDIGYGKDRAESKIKETVKFHAQNSSCKYVIMGGVSHDPNYAAFITENIGDKEDFKRISVIEGSSTVRDIASTGVNLLNFKEVFRSQKLIPQRMMSMDSVQSGSSRSPVVSAPGTPIFSYATAIQKPASPPPVINLPIKLKPLAPKTPNIPKKQTPPPAWNPGPRGLDVPIPLTQSALDTIKKRKDNNKLCNNHFLRGPCAKGEDCCFVHDYRPNKEEKNAIAFLARQNPCTNGQDCDVVNCIYGHHCPSVVNGICTHPFCKFRPEEHPPGTKLRVAKA